MENCSTTSKYPSSPLWEQANLSTAAFHFSFPETSNRLSRVRVSTINRSFGLTSSAKRKPVQTRGNKIRVTKASISKQFRVHEEKFPALRKTEDNLNKTSNVQQRFQSLVLLGARVKIQSSDVTRVTFGGEILIL